MTARPVTSHDEKVWSITQTSAFGLVRRTLNQTASARERSRRMTAFVARRVDTRSLKLSISRRLCPRKRTRRLSCRTVAHSLNPAMQRHRLTPAQMAAVAAYLNYLE